jgi:hypothetical protein
VAEREALTSNPGTTIKQTNKYALFVLGTVLHAKDLAVNKTTKNLVLVQAILWWRRRTRD